MKKSKKKAAKKKSVKKKTAKKAVTREADHYNTSEEFLITPLEEELKDAWYAIRQFGESLGDQRIYASGRAIMFSRRVCYFFVRPKKSYLEVVIFLKRKLADSDFRRIEAVSKTKFSHVFRLVHADQVEGILTDAITEAYESSD